MHYANQLITKNESSYSLVIGVAKRAREIADELYENGKTLEEKPVKKTARKVKAEPEKAEEAPKKRGRKPKAEAEPKVEKAPAKRTRKPKEPKE